MKKIKTAQDVRGIFEKLVQWHEDQGEVPDLCAIVTEWLDNLKGMDYFGTEGQHDPRINR